VWKNGCSTTPPIRDYILFKGLHRLQRTAPPIRDYTAYNIKTIFSMSTRFLFSFSSLAPCLLQLGPVACLASLGSLGSLHRFARLALLLASDNESCCSYCRCIVRSSFSWCSGGLLPLSWDRACWGCSRTVLFEGWVESPVSWAWFSYQVW